MRARRVKLRQGVGDGTWFHIHSRVELSEAGDYRACGECWQVCRTEAELIDAFMNDQLGTARDEARPGDAGEVIVCPLCSHDF